MQNLEIPVETALRRKPETIVPLKLKRLAKDERKEEQQHKKV